MIDEAYLRSGLFQSFQQAYVHEQQVRQQHASDLKKIIRQHGDDFQLLSLPVSFDEKKINKVLAGSHVKNPSLYGSYYAVGSMYIIGKVQFKDVTLFLFLHNDALRTYDDYTLWGATLYKGAMQDVQPLARYRKNLKEHTKSFMRIVSQDNIVIFVQHTVIYPTKFTIAQSIKSEYHYPINAEGRILTPDRF